MYALQQKRKELTKLELEIFPVQQKRYYKEHHLFTGYERLLHSINEIKMLIVSICPAHNRFQQEYQYVGESHNNALKRAKSSGSLIVSENTIHTHDGWYQKDLEEILSAQSLNEVLQISLRVMQQLKSGPYLWQVCGPISAGPSATKEDNLWSLHQTVQKLKQKEVVFDQTPLNAFFLHFHERRAKNGDTTYPLEILEKVYLPLFESGMIRNLAFKKGWQHSSGAQWEHDQGSRLGMGIHYLPENYV